MTPVAKFSDYQHRRDSAPSRRQVRRVGRDRASLSAVGSNVRGLPVPCPAGTPDGAA